VGSSDVPEHASFEALMSSVKQGLDEAVRAAVAEQNAIRSGRFHQGGQPLVSCFVNDCLERGKDLDQGGARYNWLEMSFVGLANLVDALAAIRNLVFERREISLRELAEALREDFAGREALRLSLLNKCPKYGNDLPEVDDLAVEITGWVAETCARHRTYFDAAVVPGFFCWVMHEHLGSQTGASADGRRAGFALGDGSGPAQGRERKGPTAAVLSTTRWNHEPMLGGIAMNLKFTPEADRGRLANRIAEVVTTYCNEGGFEIQVNVVDNATLRTAQADPENHRDLVVRIGGYSDYFVALSPGMQEEVIARSEMAAR
jgi:formate C-acetyltransferase